MDKADFLVELAEEQVGGSYVFGAWGEMCTPEYRKKRAAIAPKYKDAIYKYCPVLSGKQKTCDRCARNGRIAADCRGFTDWLLKKAGVIDLYGDTVTTQYNTASNWDGVGGTIDYLPYRPCILFRRDSPGKYGHTGFYDGNGWVIHAKGHAAGIVKERVEDTKFTNWKIPHGLYGVENEEEKNMQIIRFGSVDNAVKKLQERLNLHGAALNVDGKFGAKTTAAVLAFQRANGLTTDGIVGQDTWAALEKAPVKEPDVTVPVSTITRAEFDALAARVAWLEQSGGEGVE